MDKERYLLFVVFVCSFFMPALAGAQVFYVSNPADFQTVLNKAEKNDQDDVINVLDNMTITAKLNYNGETGHTLTINGNGHSLDGGGSVSIMNIYAYSSGSHITIKDLTFQNGRGGNGGGLVVMAGSADVTLQGCTFSGNSANSGGGAYVNTASGTATLTNNTFTGNSARWGGGADVHTLSGTVTLKNNTFAGNSADHSGGGTEVGTNSGTATLTNNTFTGNSAGWGGGAYIRTSGGSATLTNNTFSGNSADHNGGGIWVGTRYDTATANIYNNIIWDDTADDGNDLYVQSDGDHNQVGSTINLYNNDLGPNSDFTTGRSEDLWISVRDNYHHVGNIKADPECVNENETPVFIN